MKIIITIFITIITFSLLSAQPGNLDEFFNEEGQVVTHFDGLSARPKVVKIQDDGKIVVAGLIEKDIVVTRYLSDGTLDISFNKTGKLIIDIYGESDRCSGMELLPNGKILLVATANTIPSDSKIVLIQLNEDSSMDMDFGKEGIAQVGLNNQERAYDLLLSNDKIIVTGRSDIHFSTQTDILCRFNQDGTIDTSFGEDGFVFHDNGYINWAFNLLQDDGKIVVGGFTFENENEDVVLYRYNKDGSLDLSFGDGGKILTDFNNGDESAFDGVIQRDGKIVLVGVGKRIGRDFLVLRYNIDGSLDKTFGKQGRVLLDINDGSNVSNSIGLQEDGKILVSGFMGIRPRHNFALARLNIDGSIDEDFGESGIVLEDFGNDDLGLAMAIQPDHKILVVGSTIDDDKISSFALVRYLSGLEVNTQNIKLDHENLSISPNPVQSKAVFNYTLNQDQEINIDLFDINGKWVQSFIRNEKRKQGSYQKTINLDLNLADGVYFLTINREVGIKLFVKR